jgi:hypothetical protein
MQPLKVEPYRKLVEEEVRSIEQKVGAKPHVAVQNHMLLYKMRVQKLQLNN